jgi:hypothetical protein
LEKKRFNPTTGAEDELGVLFYDYLHPTPPLLEWGIKNNINNKIKKEVGGGAPEHGQKRKTKNQNRKQHSSESRQSSPVDEEEVLQSRRAGKGR